MWVQLRAPKQIDRFGKRKAFHPGDWVDVGEQLARSWIADGSAWIPPQRTTELIGDDHGIVVINASTDAIKRSGDTKIKAVQSGKPRLEYPMTLLWQPQALLRHELLPVGFSLLKTWQAACPLWDYDVLASQVGTEEERERTRAVIRDLRVPLYDTNLIYVKRCGDTERLIDRWNEEMTEGGDEKLAFLRALYWAKPLILALPITWTGKKGPPEN
jgi:hypothetical protein